jgi:hypothetical protein
MNNSKGIKHTTKASKEEYGEGERWKEKGHVMKSLHLNVS